MPLMPSLALSSLVRSSFRRERFFQRREAQVFRVFRDSVSAPGVSVRTTRSEFHGSSLCPRNQKSRLPPESPLLQDTGFLT
jgi:hypothetical protein